MHPAGGVAALTDGAIGELISGGSVPNYATCGDVASGTGQYVIYSLKGSPAGYNLSSIVTYGGWPDYGRDWQYYTVSYATAANPTNFQTLGQSLFQFLSLIRPHPRTPVASPGRRRVALRWQRM